MPLIIALRRNSFKDDVQTGLTSFPSEGLPAELPVAYASHADDPSSVASVYDKEPDRTKNSYHLFTAGGREWLMLDLEVGPRDAVIRWANEVVARYPTRTTIVGGSGNGWLRLLRFRPDGKTVGESRLLAAREPDHRTRNLRHPDHQRKARSER